jgi:hypothetical protein
LYEVMKWRIKDALRKARTASALTRGPFFFERGYAMELSNSGPVPGDDIEGPILRPEHVWVHGAIDWLSGGQAIAMRLAPPPGDDYKEPVVVLIPVERVEVFIGLIRMAQALLKSSSPEGSA